MAQPISQIVQPPVLQGGTSPNPNPGNQVLSQASGNPWGIGVGTPTPITQGQQAGLFEQPQNVQGVNNSTGQNIQGAYGLAGQNAPQANVGNNALAGLTTLGNVNINTNQSNGLLSGQIANINALQAQAAGQGPSLAAEQAQMTGQQNVANQMAMLGSQRGGAGNTALGLQSAQNQAAAANQQAVQAAVQGRTAEEISAQQQLTGALSGTQGQVMQGAQAQAALNQQTALQQGSMNQQIALANSGVYGQYGLANLQALQGTQALNTGEYNAALQAQMNQANAQMQGNENYANMITGENTQLQGINAGVGIANQSNQYGLAGAGIAGGSALGAAGINAAYNTPSDKRLKTNIKSGTRSVKDFLSQLNSNKTKVVNGFNLMGI